MSPYLHAGKRRTRNAACGWLPPSLQPEPSDAVIGLQREIPHIRDYLQTGQLENLIPCHQWYLPNGTMETERNPRGLGKQSGSSCVSLYGAPRDW